MRRLLFAAFLSCIASLCAFAEPRNSGDAVIAQMNFARQHPQQCATLLAELRGGASGGSITLTGGTRLTLHEGSRAVDEAIAFLRSQSPLPPLSASTGISLAARDHCAEQAGGGFGHVGSGGSHACDRMNRYGVWHGGWAENVAYGKRDPRDVVLALIIDDGQPARKHRKNIFNPLYNFAGAAFGSHAHFGAVCTIAFAGSYAERGADTAEPLVARNF